MQSSYEEELSHIQGDISKANVLSSRFYTSEEIYSLELERIFYSKWLVACHVSQLDTVGNIFPFEVGDKSILISRTSDGRILAFYNVCRHRGTKLLETPKNGVVIQCPYHSWTFNLEGRLIGVPDLDNYRDFDRERYGLYPVKLETWGGFVFVNLDRNSQSLDSYLGDFAAWFGKYRTGEMAYVSSLRYEVDANWKILMENGNECYHCPTVHPETLKPYYKQYGSFDQTKITGAYTLFQFKRFLDSAVGKDDVQDDSARRLGMDAEDAGVFQMPTVFPNTQFGFTPAYDVNLSAWPLGPQRCRVALDFYAHKWPGCAEETRDSMKMWDLVARQDSAICELAQAGLRSGVFDGGRLNILEEVLLHFERIYAQAITG